MFRFKMQPTDEYERLVKFFIENGLEFTDEDLVETPTEILKCWKITQGEEDFLVAACVLAFRDGEYIIDGIAVDKIMRKSGVGRILVNKVLSEVKKRGGNALYLVARAPEFFAKIGFTEVDPSDAPNFFECKTCPQYNVNCHPKVMKYVINRE